MINLTQHPASAEQIAAGVIDLLAAERAALQRALTFEDLPSEMEIWGRASQITKMATGHESAMIGGALWLMAPLAEELRRAGIRPVFAFSIRETEEQPQPDGSVRKVAVFRHRGWVDAV